MATGTPGGKLYLVEPQEIQALLVDRVGPEHLTGEQRMALDGTGSRWSDRG